MPAFNYEFWEYDLMPFLSILTVELKHCAPHLHREIELCYILDGTVEVFCRNERFTLHPGSHVLFPRRTVHELFSTDSTRPVHLMRIKISEHFFRAIYPEFDHIVFDELCPGVHADEESRQQIEQMYLHLAQVYYDQRPQSALVCASLTAQLMQCLLSRYAWHTVSSDEMTQLRSREDRADRIARYIQSHCTERITLETIAKQENISACRLSHFISSQLSVSFQEYLSRCRCHSAIHLLTDGSVQTLTEVALSSGFQDTRQMNSAFLRHFGFTPVQYRDTILQNADQKEHFFKSSPDCDQFYLTNKEAQQYIAQYVRSKCGFETNRIEQEEQTMDIQYTIKRLPEDCGHMPLSGEFSPIDIPEPWKMLNEAKLAHYPWKDTDGGYTPECAARVGWNSQGIHVLMYANEPIIRAAETRTGGNIYQDSCMEFFLAPTEGDLKYANCEVNPMAVMHLGAGDNRYGRKVFTELPEGFAPVHSEHHGVWWAVSYTLPAAFLKEYFGFTPVSGAHVRGNFYNCGDYENRPHHGMFKPYAMEKPDYHRPELFADMMLE